MARFGLSILSQGVLTAVICAMGGGAEAQAQAPVQTPIASFTQLAAFPGGVSGANPSTPLIADDFGSLYGMTEYSGAACAYDTYDGCGTIYKLDGTGQLTTLFAFPGGGDGAQPITGLTLLRRMLFGTTQSGGPNDGVVFSIGTDGSHYSVMHQFEGLDGAFPTGLLQPAPYGGLYGVTGHGGPTFATDGGRGLLFYVQSDGRYKILHDFLGQDGLFPQTLVEDAAGDLLGSTLNGGDACTTVKHGCGVVFEYQPASKTFTVLHAFAGGADGQSPLLGGIAPDGTIYGVTKASGGAHGHGTLFSLAPRDGGFSYANLAAFPPAHYGIGPLAAPAVARNGGVLIPTPDALYGYRNGRLRPVYSFNVAAGVPYVSSQLFIPSHGTTAYGVENDGGTSPCMLITGYSEPGGCGTIVSFATPGP